MKYIDFKQEFQEYIVFSLQDIRKIDPLFDKRRLTEWLKKGYIIRAAQRHYLFADTPQNEQLLFLVANKIYSPSYISFETALSYYAFIPEGVYTMTSATTKKTKVVRSSFSNFSYHSLKPALFFGYHLLAYGNQRVLMAEPEKALLDYFYIHSHLNTAADMEEMRFNSDECQNVLQTEKMTTYLKQYHNTALTKRVNLFLDTLYA